MKAKKSSQKKGPNLSGISDGESSQADRDAFIAESGLEIQASTSASAGEIGFCLKM